ncbi:NUDIX domain-containing protein [Natronorubrum aibiense]|uniref:Nudix hydrolase domain-containing protein n=1 Tax=Natronorubrum aibiense TaxID=348826 RepID=A0A5P9P0K5_9EURY|nr:NUDIX domain-containing protein [Natronorubrum aibiense]QFU81654.1 hypothetical protein GCU68_03300 [Natronorubrum aibiense]
MELPDPETLCDREDVECETETRSVTRGELEAARDIETHVTVGIINDGGDVLWIDDGSRDWTLPAAPVSRNETWATAARRIAAAATGVDVDLDAPVRVRRVAFQHDDQRHTTYNVVVRTAPVSGRPVGDEPIVPAGDDSLSGSSDEPTALGTARHERLWLDHVPESESTGVDADVRSVLE